MYTVDDIEIDVHFQLYIRINKYNYNIIHQTTALARGYII